MKVFVGFAALVASASGSSVTPVQKVIQLLEGMAAKGKEEKQNEQVQFAAYKQFCDDTSVEKKRAITEANEAINVLNADIEKYTADASRLTKEIAGHDEDVSVWTGDSKAATKVRSIEKADYDKTHQDYSESVDALERAIAVVKKQSQDRPQALLQLQAVKKLRLFPDSARKTIDAFLAEDSLSGSAPEANAYEFQSSGIVEMLEKLLDKFIAERTTLEKEEMNSKQAFEMLLQDLTAQIEQASAERESKATTKAKKLEAKATAEGDLADTTATRNADQKYLDDLVATCEQKSSDFASRQQLRAEEIEAVEKAIEIISSGAVSGAADKHLPALAQLKSSALAQLRADSTDRQNQDRVVKFLQAQAGKLGSRVLAQLAVKVAEDPFGKVKKMIKDLIVRLMEEANEEAEHKGWCDTELSTNEQTRKEKTDAVETLHSEIDELEASIAKLTEDIAELSQAVTELAAAMAKATTLRQEEKATNTATIADAQAAQTAVAQALTVLKEFYAKAGDATALVQQKQPAPEVFDSPYKGMQSENGGVVGMIEVIQSDFARLEADTKASEASAQKEYDEFMTDSTVDKESKATDIEHKTAKKQDQTQALTVAQKDLAGTQKELDAALAYFDKLKPSCVEAGVEYDDRVARRKEEIQSLQEALQILNGEAI
jgi:cell division septum initiation protein DivIVA